MTEGLSKVEKRQGAMDNQARGEKPIQSGRESGRITKEELRRLLALDDNKFIDEVDRRYRADMQSVIRHKWKEATGVAVGQDVVEEIYNDSLLDVHKARRRFDLGREGEFGGLLRTIAVTNTLDRIKKANRMKRRSEVPFPLRRDNLGDLRPVEIADPQADTGRIAEIRSGAKAINQWAIAAHEKGVIDALDFDIINYSLEEGIAYTDPNECGALAKHFGHPNNQKWKERLEALAKKVDLAAGRDYRFSKAA